MQIVKYKWDISGLHGQPFLFLRNESKIEKMKLFDEDLKIKIGKRHCIGYTKNGKQISCPKNREVNDEKICKECALNDDFFLCMKCDGSMCINESQRESCKKNKYFIYLAAFDKALKVGISYEFRLMERLIEQGADLGAKIGVIKDGMIVREVEQKIKKELNIIDRLTGQQKHGHLFGSPNTAALNISNAYRKLKFTELSKYLVTPEIFNLQETYRLGQLKSKPVLIHPSEGTVIKGSVKAAKGNLIVFEGENELFSVNAHSLIGSKIELFD